MAANPSLIERGVGSTGLGPKGQARQQDSDATDSKEVTGTPKMSSQTSLPCHFAFGGGQGTNGSHSEEAGAIFSGRLLTAPDKRQDYGEASPAATQ